MADSYSVACGSTDITPREPIPLAGYATLRKATFDRIADPLEANVIALRKGAGTVVFVALDLMYVGAYLRDAIDKAGGSRVAAGVTFRDRKSTRLNSSHLGISYAVFCLKKKSKSAVE